MEVSGGTEEIQCWNSCQIGIVVAERTYDNRAWIKENHERRVVQLVYSLKRVSLEFFQLFFLCSFICSSTNSIV